MSANAETLSIGRISLAPECRQAPTGLDVIQAGSPAEMPTTLVIGEGYEDVVGGGSCVLDMDDPWLCKVDLAEAKNIILNFNAGRQRMAKPFTLRRLEWPLRYALLDLTDLDLAPVFNKLDEETAQFVVEHDLASGVAWVQAAMPRFFDGADFEIELLPADDEEDNLLGLKVYGWFNSSEFRKRRHAMCEAMLLADHRSFYEVISIFQRRVTGSGWQAFSCYSALSAE